MLFVSDAHSGILIGSAPRLGRFEYSERMDGAEAIGIHFGMPDNCARAAL